MTLLERLGGRNQITQGIVETFRTLSRHPHPSWHETQTGRDVADWLTGLGLETRTDAAGNLCTEIPASPGREMAPKLIIQGHIDMVCAVAPGSGYNPLTDPVQIRIRDSWLCTDGRSSLGADNMLGNAAVLWLLSTGRVAHGPLRLIFTVAEEVGLEGAKQVDPAWLADAEYLLNTDGFHLGRAIVGSACGRRETFTRRLETVAAPEGGQAWRVELTGGTGGHSGYDIHRGRANAVKVLGELLARLCTSTECALAEWESGMTHNAIPAEGSFVVVLPPEGEEILHREIEHMRDYLYSLHWETDPSLELKARIAPTPRWVWTDDCRDGAIHLVGSLFSGVAAMHPSFPGTVGDSANLGAIGMDGDQLQVRAFLRCHDEAAELALADGRQELGTAEGFEQKLSRYPAWPGSPNNPLAMLLAQVYQEQNGGELEISAVHVGLEPSIFREKAPGLTMISTGPEILDAHSVDERAPLHSLPNYALLLAGFLEAL